MKACPTCGRLYPEDAGFCPVDGVQLGRATQVPVGGEGQDRRIGQLVCARYQIRRVVADGGMGRVYEALDLEGQKNVALKILHPDVASDDISVERFKREFEVSKQLPHEHIVDVLDFQPTQDRSYALVMEFLYGEELRATLKRESVLPPARVIRMLSQVAIGLDAAHARKLVHRDLKPDNLFLCQTNEGDIVKVLDFGSVKDKGETAKKLTVLGTTIGSPYYMAPEQAQGLDTLDQRADVWALAAIAYECVAGQVPFQGSNGPAILLQILTQEPTPPSVVGKGKRYPVPPTLDTVMAQAFKKQAVNRIASVGALADGIGLAYGLKGNHLEWARLREDELQRQIDERLPELLLKKPAPVAKASAADEFFGESGALDGPGLPGQEGASGAVSVRPAPLAEADDLAPRGVPTRGAGKGMLLAIAGGAILVGAVIAFLVLAH